MDIKKRRRQIAWLCFEPYLSEAQLIQAIEILEYDFQMDGAISLMTYVAKICMKMGVDLQNHKAICAKFNELLVADVTEILIADPLLLVIKKEENKAFSGFHKIQSPAKQQEKAVYCLVFASFMESIFACVPNRISLFAMLLELATDKKLQFQDLASYVMQWTENPNSYTWSEELNQQTLTRLVHLVYMSLCEVAGPVVADDCFHKALAICEQKPEARIFAPSQFL